jgi:hypothetical protein
LCVAKGPPEAPRSRPRQIKYSTETCRSRGSRPYRRYREHAPYCRGLIHDCGGFFSGDVDHSGDVLNQLCFCEDCFLALVAVGGSPRLSPVMVLDATARIRTGSSGRTWCVALSCKVGTPCARRVRNSDLRGASRRRLLPWAPEVRHRATSARCGLGRMGQSAAEIPWRLDRTRGEIPGKRLDRWTPINQKQYRLRQLAKCQSHR